MSSRSKYIPDLSHLKVAQVTVPWEPASTPELAPREATPYIDGEVLASLWSSSYQEDQTFTDLTALWLSELEASGAPDEIEFSTPEDSPPQRGVRTRVDRATRHPDPIGPRAMSSEDYISEARPAMRGMSIREIREMARTSQVEARAAREAFRQSQEPTPTARETRKTPMERAAEFTSQPSRWDRL